LERLDYVGHAARRVGQANPEKEDHPLLHVNLPEDRQVAVVDFQGADSQ
jgi:hypothetical protein